MKPSKTYNPQEQHLRARNILRIALFLAAVIMLAVGIADGEVQTVFQKAVNICLECIGIG